MTRVMSALKKGALLKAFPGKPADVEKVLFPYDGRVILKDTGRERCKQHQQQDIFFSFKYVYRSSRNMSRDTSQVA